MRSRALPGGQSEMLHLWRLFFVVMVTRAALASAFGTTPGTTNSEVQKDYCANDKFQVSCDGGHVILMMSAVYGRMRSGRCVGGVSLGCQTDVIRYMDDACSGRQACSLGVNDIDLYAQPCPRDYKSYLQASYRCVKVTDTGSCQAKTVEVPAAAGGYFAGQVGDTVGTYQRCAFTIEAELGQKVTLYLYSFPPTSKSMEGGRKPGHLGSVDCRNHMTIQDGGKKETMSLCPDAASLRYRLVFTSTTNRLVVHIKHGRTKYSSEARFIIEYKSVGCADMKPHKHAWLERTGEDLVVRCNTTGDIWYLTCQGSQWVGQIGNCTTFLDKEHDDSSEKSPIDCIDQSGLEAIFGDGIPFQQGIALAVGVGIIVGAILGALLLLCVWTIRKGTRETNKPTVRHTEVAPPDGKPRYEERNMYPSLLNQDRTAIESAAYEYTHVWDPNFTTATTGGSAKRKEIDIKLIPLNKQTSSSDSPLCSAHSAKKAIIDPRPSRPHVYETPRGQGHEEDFRLRGPGDLPTYYDVDPEGKCDRIHECKQV